MLGTCTGQLKLYNVFTGQEEASYNCHTSAITHLEPSRVSGRSHTPRLNFVNVGYAASAGCRRDNIYSLIFMDPYQSLR